MSGKYFGFIVAATAILGSLAGVVLNAPEAKADHCSSLDFSCPPSHRGGCLFSGGSCNNNRRTPDSSVGNGSARLNQTRVFKFFNRSGQTVVNLYLSPSHHSNWGRDILGDYVLPNGTTFDGSIRPNLDGCRYDIRAIFADGRESEAAYYDACSTSGININ